MKARIFAALACTAAIIPAFADQGDARRDTYSPPDVTIPFEDANTGEIVQTTLQPTIDADGNVRYFMPGGGEFPEDYYTDGQGNVYPGCENDYAVWNQVSSAIQQNYESAKTLETMRQALNNLSRRQSDFEEEDLAQRYEDSLKQAKSQLEDSLEQAMRTLEADVEAERTAREAVEAQLLESIAALSDGNVPDGAGITNLINDLISDSLGGDSVSNLVNVAIAGLTGSESFSNLVTGAVSDQLGSGAISNAISSALADYLGSTEFGDEIQARLGDFFGGTAFAELVSGSLSEYLGGDEFGDLISSLVDGYLDSAAFGDLIESLLGDPGGVLAAAISNAVESAVATAMAQELDDLVSAYFESSEFLNKLAALMEGYATESYVQQYLVDHVEYYGGGCNCDSNADNYYTVSEVNKKVSDLLDIINALAGNNDYPSVKPTF